MSGTLYLVGTPIGNLEDMTFRAVRILGEVSWIAAEDTRQTRKLLSHYGVSTRLVSYHEHNKEASGKGLIDRLLDGDSVAIVSDAGLPAISDPGGDLVRSAIDHGIPVVPIPGANAALTALIASGLPSERFYFVGFLPRENKQRQVVLDAYRYYEGTLIFYEAPHRMMRTMESILEAWGDREAVVARELTKKYEQFIRGTLSECSEQLAGMEIRGEFCLLVQGATEAERREQAAEWWQQMSIEEHVSFYERQHGDRKQAMKQTAQDRQVSRREIYQALHRTHSDTKKIAPVTRRCNPTDSASDRGFKEI